MLASCQKCGSAQEIKLKVKRDGKGKILNKVAHCMTCGTDQDNFSKYMLDSMEKMKDIVEDSSNKVPFGVECKACSQTGQALYDPKTKSAVCDKCGADLQLNPYMIRAIEQAGYKKT